MPEAKESILVTGASAGIGRATAIRLASDGYEVAIHYGKNLQGAEQTRDAIHAASGRCRILSFDVSDCEDTRTAIEADIAQHGAYYGVISNAGITRDNVFPMLSEDDWRQVIDVNLNGLYNVLQPVVMPLLQRRKPGRIVTISSVSGIMGNRGQVNYAASKAGIIGFTRSVSKEVAKYNITVNAISPGYFDIGMFYDID